MAKKGHFQGHKQRGTHTTVIPKAEAIIKAVRKMPYVVGINARRIEQARSHQSRVNFEQTQTGLKVVVLSATSKQTIILQTTCPQRVEKELKAIV